MEISKNRVIPEVDGESRSGGAGRRYGGIDRDERQRQRHDRLIGAGLAVFGAQGYHASTVRDICKHAQLTSRYFYESFTGMEALFEAVYRQVSTDLMSRTLQVLQATPMEPERLAAAALRTFLEFLRDDPHRARVMLIDSLTVGPGISRLSSESNRDFAQLITGLMEQVMPEVGRSGLSPVLMSNGLVGSNVRIATLWVEDGCILPLEEVLDNMLALHLAAIAFIQRRNRDIGPRVD